MTPDQAQLLAQERQRAFDQFVRLSDLYAAMPMADRINLLPVLWAAMNTLQQFIEAKFPQ